MRFKLASAPQRDALRNFFRDSANLVGEAAAGSGRFPVDLIPFLQALPIFPVFTSGGGAETYHTLRTLAPSGAAVAAAFALAEAEAGDSGSGSGSDRGGAFDGWGCFTHPPHPHTHTPHARAVIPFSPWSLANVSPLLSLCGHTRSALAEAARRCAKHLPPDEDLSPAALDEAFVRCRDGRDRGFLEQLGVRRLGAARLFLGHLLPRLDPDAFLEVTKGVGSVGIFFAMLFLYVCVFTDGIKLGEK